jgi:hypothetical protein
MPLRPLSHSCNLFAVSVGMIEPFKLAPPENLPCLPNRRNPSHRDAGQARLSMPPMRYDGKHRQAK